MNKRERNEEKSGISTYASRTDSSITSNTKVYQTLGRIRKIGNSKGILLSARVLKELGVPDDSEVNITTDNGRIIITPITNSRKINTDLSTWEAQFKAAIENGDKPEADLFGGVENTFDKEEW